jgi:cell division septal protein FtsQ
MSERATRREDPRVRARRRRRSAAHTALWVAIGLAALFVGASHGPAATREISRRLRNEPFLLEALEVLGTRRLDAQAVAAASGLRHGTPLVDVDPERVEERVAALAGVASVRSLRIPPDRFVLDVVERTPRAVLAAGPAAGFVVCERGVAFARARPSERAGLPSLRTQARVKPGEAHADVALAVDLIAALTAHGLVPAEIELPARERTEGPRVRLRGLRAGIDVGWEPWDAALGRLVQLLATRPELALAAQEIDVRFAGQAVVRGDGGTASGEAEQAAATRGRAAPSNTPRSG